LIGYAWRLTHPINTWRFHHCAGQWKRWEVLCPTFIAKDSDCRKALTGWVYPRGSPSIYS